jgi:type IV pilus assembly protein PilY1
MLHAVNMGFQKSLLSGLNGYEDSDPKFIGREMWAFIPQSVLPHLQWLGQTDYAHSYYLDLTPTVVEIKDPAKGEAQGGPWRTIVLGSLRFGGRAIEMGNGNYSYSEVFALDVTDPDKEPVLLWRFSHPQLGLVVARPTVVRNNQQGDHWYVLVGSGPTYDAYNPKTLKTETTPDGPLAYKGYSNQSAKIFVFDAVRGPSAGVEILDSNRPKSFFTSMQALTAPGSSVKDEQGSVSWNNNLAYFSLNQSALDNDLLCLTNATQTGAYLDASNPAHLCGRSKYSNYGYLDKGGVWRLNMSGPLSSWKSNLAVFYDADRPVTGAVNTTYDASGRLWVIFGSGRFWTNDDSRLCEGSGDTKECWVNHVNYLYGIKEPVSPQTGELTYGPVAEASLVDVSNVLVYPDGEVGVAAATGGLEAFRYGTEVITSYSQLYSRIMSESSGGYRRALKTNSTNFIDSEEIDSPGDKKYETRDDWWSGLSFEMILEQVAVAPFGGGSIMSLSTFLPRSLSCGSNGHSYGLLLDTFTGLPRPEFGTAPFLEKNQFQFSNAPAGANGARAVSDHVASVGGKSAAAVFVVTGTNEGKHGQFEIVNSDGTVTVFKIPDNDTIKGGVLSWREVLDFSIAGQ